MSPITRLTLFRRFNGIWYILYYVDGIQKWKSTGCTVKSEALLKLTQFQHLLKEKSLPKKLSEFTAEFVSYASESYAKSTIDIFKIGLRHLSEVAGDCRIADLTPKHLDLYRAKRIKEVSPTSVNIELRGLRGILNVAVRWGLLDTNPFQKVRLVQVPERVPVYVAQHEFGALLRLIKDDWFRELIVLAALTGLRRGEIVNLRWTNIDFSRKLLQVESSATFRVKCGKRRTIPLNEMALHLLASRYGKDRGEYVFELEGRRIEGGHLSHKFKDCIRQAGLDDGLHFHSLRHSFATWLIQNGANIYEVQKLLGHSSVQVTEIYSHLLPNELHGVVNRLNAANQPGIGLCIG